jgi:CDP-2,3-bis-(O-geranylgeranyl)-sn-glycerol synthase
MEPSGPEFSLLFIVMGTIWMMLPAYLSNTIASIVGGGAPIDRGRNWSDGRRILGDGKTWRGLFGGTLGGVLIGHLQLFFNSSDDSFKGIFEWTENPYWIFFLLAFGALAGDIAASFVKRRRGQERGTKSPILDMYDFIIGALAFVIILGGGWHNWIFTWNKGIEYSVLSIPTRYLPIPIITLLIVTPILHRSVNILGYKLGVKQVPW